MASLNQSRSCNAILSTPSFHQMLSFIHFLDVIKNHSLSCLLSSTDDFVVSQRRKDLVKKNVEYFYEIETLELVPRSFGIPQCCRLDPTPNSATCDVGVACGPLDNGN
jgi:hypothetical protein